MSYSSFIARGSRRPRSPSGLSDDASSNNAPFRDVHIARRRKNKESTPEIGEKLYFGYFALGQYLGRCFDPMVPICQVLIYAKAFIIGSGSEDAEDVNDGPTQRYYTRAWDAILCVFPDVEDELQKLSLDEFKARIQAIKSGMSAVRSADANRLKTNTADYAPLDPNVENVVLSVGRSKMDRGFNHPVLGRLLIPVNLLAEYNEDRHKVVNRIESGQYRITALQFPTFLYQEGSYDPENLLNGLFRGHFLIRCCISIFLGPQSALSAPGQVVVSRSCIANRFNVSKITPQIIAYICVQARFTLTTAGTWSYQDGGFDYPLFHRKITNLFDSENGYYDVWTTSTLEWWNKQVFGNKDGNPTLIASTNSKDEDPNNCFARIEAQVARRKDGMAGTPMSEPTTFENTFEDIPSTPPRLTSPTPAPSSSAIVSSPVTPLTEGSDNEIDCHPKYGRTRNPGTKKAPLGSQKKGGRRGKSGNAKARRR